MPARPPTAPARSQRLGAHPYPRPLRPPPAARILARPPTAPALRHGFARILIRVSQGRYQRLECSLVPQLPQHSRGDGASPAYSRRLRPPPAARLPTHPPTAPALHGGSAHILIRVSQGRYQRLERPLVCQPTQHFNYIPARSRVPYPLAKATRSQMRFSSELIAKPSQPNNVSQHHYYSTGSRPAHGKRQHNPIKSRRFCVQHPDRPFVQNPKIR